MTVNHAILSCAPKNQPHTIALPSDLYDTLVEKSKKYDEIMAMTSLKNSKYQDLVFDIALTLGCNYYGQDKQSVLSQSREKRLMDVRYVVVMCLVSMNIPQQQIATFLNRKDHTTVLHIRNQLSDLIDCGGEYKEDMDKLLTIFKLKVRELQKYQEL